MTYDGYLNFGGNEIANNLRTRGYAQTADCPMFWFKGDVCPTLWAALGETDLYSYANITKAPWYDSANPESMRFYGVYIIDIEGLENSTRQVAVTEGVGHGGVLGPTRKGVKTVRVRAILAAQGTDALEYGMAWLSAALDPGTCGQHGTGCGTTDLAFFAACPPDQADVTLDTETWSLSATNYLTNPSEELSDGTVTLVTNYATNPSFEAISGSNVEVRRNMHTDPRMVNGAQGGWTNVREPVTMQPDGVQFNITNPVGSGDWIGLHGEMLLATTGMPWISSVEIEVPAGYPAVSLFWQWEERNDLVAAELIDPNSTDGINALLDGTAVTIYPGQALRLSTPEGSRIGTSNRGRAILRVGPGGVPAGARFITRRIMSEAAQVIRPYFDGNTATYDGSDWEYAWTGSVDGSASIVTGKTVTDVQGGNTIVSSSREWTSDRARSIRVASAGTVNDSYASIGGDNGGLRLGMLPGRTYTARAVIRQDKPLTGTLSNRARSVMVHYGGGAGGLLQRQSEIGPNVAGVYELDVTFTLPSDANTAFIRLYNGSAIGGEEVWWDSFMLVENEYTGPYFDGATPPTSTDATPAWGGLQDASVSYLIASRVKNRRGAANGATVVHQTSQRSDDRAKSAHILAVSDIAADQAIFYPVSNLDLKDLPPGEYIYSANVWAPTDTPALVLTADPPGSAPSVASAPSTVRDGWQRLSVTFTVTEPGDTLIFVRAATANPVVSGVEWWVDSEIVMTSGGSSVYFDGSTLDSPHTTTPGVLMHRYAWTGTADDSTSIYELGVVTTVEDPIGYRDQVDDLKRFLHDTGATSGPLVTQKFESGDIVANQVEFVFTSERPWVFKATQTVELPPSLPQIVQDIPFNLAPYPSAERALGTAVVATNFAKNPSAEHGSLTGWTPWGDGTGVQDFMLLLDLSDQLSAHGSWSVLSYLEADVAIASGYFGVRQLVPLPGITANTRYSVNAWANALLQFGPGASLGVISYVAQWMDAAGNVLREDLLGTQPSATGGAVSVKSILPPAGTTQMMLGVQVAVTAIPVDGIVNVYADAFAVTVP